MFVADDLAAWLTAALADAGRRRLTGWVLGSEQERALQAAATTAVEQAAADLSPQRPGELAMVVNELFRAPSAALDGQQTLLEGLRAGIAAQLAPLGDPGLTGTGVSSADLLGIPVGVLAEKVTSALVREIVLRGARGGPLAALAAQLNHDVTHLQGQRLEGMVGQLAGELRDALARQAISLRSDAVTSVALAPDEYLEAILKLCRVSIRDLAGILPYIAGHVTSAIIRVPSAYEGARLRDSVLAFVRQDLQLSVVALRHDGDSEWQAGGAISEVPLTLDSELLVCGPKSSISKLRTRFAV